MIFYKFYSVVVFNNSVFIYVFFFAFYPHLEEKPFFQAYRDRSLVLGREVTVLERGQTRTALALDLNPDFSLQVREADGRERALASGEVRVKL